jgi:Fe-S-cluster formation regulator IscX/YfhJ
MTRVMVAMNTLTAVAVFFSICTAQAPMPCHDGDKYENLNQIDPRTLRLANLSGRTVVDLEATDSVKRIDEKVSGACVSLFTEETHHLVLVTMADGQGRWRFGSIPKGSYRLVAHAPGLCPANRQVQVVGRRAFWARSRPLVVHFRARSIDICSSIDYGP